MIIIIPIHTGTITILMHGEQVFILVIPGGIQAHGIVAGAGTVAGGTVVTAMEDTMVIADTEILTGMAITMDITTDTGMVTMMAIGMDRPATTTIIVSTITVIMGQEVLPQVPVMVPILQGQDR